MSLADRALEKELRLVKRFIKTTGADPVYEVARERLRHRETRALLRLSNGVIENFGFQPFDRSSAR